MSRECPVEVPCVSSPVPPPRRLWLHCVSGQGSAVGGGLVSGRLLLALKGQSRLGCQVPGTGVYPGV
jgi:hypothetical protein